MHITFVLPAYPRKPVGGYKIIFEYANLLSQDGFDVTIAYANEGVLSRYPIPNFLKNKCINLLTFIEPTWFKLNSKIKKVSLQGKQAKKVYNSTDIVFATAVSTVDITQRNFKSSKKIYFIQGFENWFFSDKYVYSTYNMDFIKIVISKWLKKIVEQHTSDKVYYIKNPIDTNVYKKIIPISKRNDYSIGMLYHDNPVKGSKYGLAAIKKVKEKFPQVKVYLFGTATPPEELPNWIKYYKNISQSETVKLYNKISIFVCPSIKEGFGLTGLEAMSCGAAVVSTNYTGGKEYIQNDYNAVVSEVKDIDCMSKNIISLITDKKKRIKIAKNGIKTGQDFSLIKSYIQLKEIVLNS